jgi:hypothetical protein
MTRMTRLTAWWRRLTNQPAHWDGKDGPCTTPGCQLPARHRRPHLTR